MKIIIALVFAMSILANAKILNLDDLVKKDKHLLLTFNMSFCPYCITMKYKIYKSDKISNLFIQSFILTSLNMGDDDVIILNKEKFTTKQFIKKLNLFIYPSQVFISKDKKIVYISNGYRNEEKFGNILNYVSSKFYLEGNFEDYLLNVNFDKM